MEKGDVAPEIQPGCDTAAQLTTGLLLLMPAESSSLAALQNPNVKRRQDMHNFSSTTSKKAAERMNLTPETRGEEIRMKSSKERELSSSPLPRIH
ncbi:hypothetical protein EYF80_011067 [Liparis tanakae]|uniref:Uncharacterized protein n=1 Tax=Liparis tanakae TaxID=230148 RepID=A0A4Z2INC3_9TELE|nr:hypothetical protein EYF80_011067 [Liparis tanakae]